MQRRLVCILNNVSTVAAQSIQELNWCNDILLKRLDDKSVKIVKANSSGFVADDYRQLSLEDLSLLDKLVDISPYLYILCLANNEKEEEEARMILQRFFPLVQVGLTLVEFMADNFFFPLQHSPSPSCKFGGYQLFFNPTTIILDDDDDDDNFIGEHAGLKSLLFWIRDGNIQLDHLTDSTIDDHHRALPNYIRSPISLKIKFLERIPALKVLKFTSTLPPNEVFIVLEPMGEEREFTLTLIEPAFKELFLKYQLKKCIEHQQTLPPQVSPSIPMRKRSSLLVASSLGQQPVTTTTTTSSKSQTSQNDSSISLSNWISSPNQDLTTLSSPPLLSQPQDIKSTNKCILKKLMLLSLRHLGIDKNHYEFSSIWKHLYCGCLFALRKELGTVKIDQSVMVSVIRSNMNFLNIK